MALYVLQVNWVGSTGEIEGRSKFGTIGAISHGASTGILYYEVEILGNLWSWVGIHFISPNEFEASGTGDEPGSWAYDGARESFGMVILENARHIEVVASWRYRRLSIDVSNSTIAYYLNGDPLEACM